MDACISSLDRGIEQNSIILRGISQSRVIHILQHHSEVRRCAEELGLQTIVITGELRCLAEDLLQSADQQDVVAMYQRVHKSLSDRPIGIIGFVHTGLSFLYEAHLGVVAHEFTAVA